MDLKEEFVKDYLDEPVCASKDELEDMAEWWLNKIEQVIEEMEKEVMANSLSPEIHSRDLIFLVTKKLRQKYLGKETND